MNLLQASFLILHIYYNKNFINFQKRELGANHPLHHPTKSYFVNTYILLKRIRYNKMIIDVRGV